MRAQRSVRRAPRALDQGVAALIQPLQRLSAHQAAIAGFKATRQDLERFSAYAAQGPYGALMSELRQAALLLAVDPRARAPRELLELAARALDVPVIDLLALERVAADAVAEGKWRPRSVNVDLVEPDPTRKNGPDTRLQKLLNRASDKLMPDVKEVRVPGVHGLYRLGAQVVLPVVDAAGQAIADPLAAASHVVQGWSDGLASDVQLRLRDVREATKPSALGLGDLRQLSEIEQRMMLLVAGRLSGMALDAEEFVRWARDPQAVELPRGLGSRLKRWASSGLNGLAHFLRGVASGTKNWTSAEAWRTSTLHLQFGGGIEKWTVSTRAGWTLMFPTLEQVERDGHAKLRIVSRANPVDSMFGGVTLTSRGGGLKFRAGPVGAKISEFEHEVKAGIPGIIGVSVGEDYAYGPCLALGWSPPVALVAETLGLGAAGAGLPFTPRVGGEVSIFHPALGGSSRVTRRMAEQISIGCDAVYEGVRTVGRAVGLVKSGGEVQDGWPLRQKWQLARRHVERAEFALLNALERQATLDTIPAGDLTRALGAERAAKLLGRDAERPGETQALIGAYLKQLSEDLALGTAEMRALAGEAAAGRPYARARFQALDARLRRQTLAFEFVDLLLTPMLAGVQLGPQPALPVHLGTADPRGGEPPRVQP